MKTQYAKKIKEKKFAWGGRAFATPFAAGGSVSITGSILVGSRSTKDDELASVHAQMLLEGTEQLSKQDIQIELDTMGANVGFSATNDRLLFNARVRVRHLEALLALIAEILEHPIFPEAELAILKKREEANLTMQAQDTRVQAGIALSRMFYPKDHPNYSQTTPESLAALKKISTKELKAFHEGTLNRGSLIFSAAGDVQPSQVFSLAEKYFKVLPDKKIRKEKALKALQSKPGKKAANLPEKSSIDYMIGVTTGITKDHPDFPALLIGMNVLGLPGFTGRLMQIVREVEGLTYGVYAYLQGFEPTTDGFAYTWGTFSPKLFAQGRASIQREIRRLVTEGATDEEVHKHTSMYAARIVTRMSNSGSFAQAAHQLGVENKLLTHLDTFPQRILKLTPKEINKVLKKYIKLDKLSESAAGPIEKL